jgi:hypothetical protein
MHDIDSDNDDELQRALHASPEEEQFARGQEGGGGDDMMTVVGHLSSKVAC